MKKARAIELLGGTPATAAKAIGITYQAVDKWPEDLPRRIADRVLAVLARKHLPSELIGDERTGDTPGNPTSPPAVGLMSLPGAVRHRALAAGEG